ncbi:MAG: NTP/NDP exchange transporter [Chlamydiae bacterium]|nr:NTP/NDP exchange transporter [Chlamydiota bacterium]
MNLNSKEPFGPIREILWPIHRSELKKVLSMFFLMSFLCICYSILRNLKDTVILTAKASGAEAIPFLKVWGILPGAIIGTWIFAKLCNRFSREKVFYIIITSFILYFLCFAFILYPNSEALHLESLGDTLTALLPKGFKGLISMIRNWTFTSFYIICEMWSIIVLSVLFWGFANDVTKLSEAKRSYGIFNIGANSAPIIGGGIAIFVGNHMCFPFLSTSTDTFHQTLVQLILVISIFGTLAMGMYYWIHRRVLEPEGLQTQAKFIDPSGNKKKRLSLRESLLYIWRSKYLICVACIVLGYNISINITDVLWKEQLKNFFQDPEEMLDHMNKITIGIGAIATLGALFISVMVTRLGWTFIAILTPAIMTTLALGFFAFLFCGDLLTTFSMTLFGLTPMAMTVYFGSIQNCLSKASKYSVFDASKELAFLPLDQESRIKGKAAIDGLGSGIGKSGASLTYQGFIILLGSVASSTPYIAGLLVVVLVLWMIAVVSVGKQFKTATDYESLPVANQVKQDSEQALQT